MTSTNQTDTGSEHRYHLTVDSVVELDPDRIEEWVRSNFDLKSESVQLTNLSRGDVATAPVEFEGGPAVIDLVHQGQDESNDFATADLERTEQNQQ